MHKKHRQFPVFALTLCLAVIFCAPSRAGTLSVTNGSFTNLSSNSVTGGGWYGGDPAGWTSDAAASGYTVLNSGGTYYANLQTLGPASPSFTPLRQNVGTVDITSDVTITFTLTTLSGTSSLNAALYDLNLAAYTSPFAVYSSGSITSASTVSFSAKGVGPGTALYMAFWNGGGAAGITGVSISDTATTYLWNGGASGVWTNSGGGWTDKFDNTATNYNNAKPVVVQFTNASAGTNVAVAANGVVVGNVQVDGGNYTFSGGTITMTNTTWSVATGRAATVSNVLAGTTALTKSGAGQLLLASSNSYSGGTTLSAGTLTLGNANALGSGAVTVNGGTLDLGGNNLTAVNFGGAGGTISLGTNTLTASMTSAKTFAGAITGTGGLIKTGASFLTLSGSNSYSGGTTINEGTIFLTGSGTIGDASGAIVISNSASTATLDLRNAQTRTGTITMIGQGARLLSGDVNNPGSLINNGNALAMGGGQITVSISGTAGLNVTGGGVINASNSYSGATTISGTTGWYGTGTLYLENANALGAGSGDLTISGGTVSLQNNTITRSGSVTVSGGTINTGTLSKSGSNLALQGGVINATIAGTAGLTKSTTNGASLNGSNSYTGGTTISGGTLFVGGSGTLGDAAGDVTVAGSGSGSTLVVLDLRSQQTRTGTITMTNQDARIINGGGGSLVNNGVFRFGGGSLEAGVSGTGGMLVTAGGSISSSNSYTGATTISGTVGWYGQNRLFLVNASALGAGSGDLTISAGTVNLQNNTITRSGNVTISGGLVEAGMLSKSGGSFGLQGGQVTAFLAGTAGLTKSGAGTATLWASNSYEGVTDIQAGRLTLASGGRLGTNAVTISNGANLHLATGAGQTNIMANAISGTGQIVNDSNSDTRLTGEVTSTGGLTINSGVVRIGNGGTNGSFTGDTVLAGGTLAFDRSDIFTYAGVISGSGTLSKVSGGTVYLGGNSTNVTGTLNIFAGTARIGDGATNGLFSGDTAVFAAGTLAFDRTDNSTYGGAISGAGSVVKVNTGAITLTASNSYSGATELYTGTVVADNADALGAGNITFLTGGGNTGTIRYTAASAGTDWASRLKNSTGTVRLDTDTNSVTLAGAIDSSNVGGLVKSGTGTLVLAGSNSYVGATVVSAGTLAITDGNALGDTASGTTVAAGAILRLVATNSGSGVTVGNEPLTLSSGASTNAALISQLSGATNTVQGKITLAANTRIDALSGNTLVLDTASGNAVEAANFSLFFGGSGTKQVVDAISLGSGKVLNIGSGTTILAAGNSYSGGTDLNLGTLRLDHANAAGSGTITQLTNTILQINTTGTVANAMSIFDVRTMQTVTLSGNKTLNNATYTVDAGTTTTESGVLSGIGGITKQGTGTLLVTGDNTYTGAVAVNEGVLELASTAGGAAASTVSVSVASGATLLLSQSDQVNNSATVSLSGGTIQRGSGVSEVFGNLSLTTGSFLDFGTGAAGNLTFGTYQNNETPSALLTLNNFLPGNSFTFSSTSFTTNSIGSYFTFGTGYAGSSISSTGSTFTITAIPEPSTYVAAAGLLAFLLWSSRRAARQPRSK